MKLNDQQIELNKDGKSIKAVKGMCRARDFKAQMDKLKHTLGECS